MQFYRHILLVLHLFYGRRVTYLAKPKGRMKTKKTKAQTHLFQLRHKTGCVFFFVLRVKFVYNTPYKIIIRRMVNGLSRNKRNRLRKSRDCNG